MNHNENLYTLGSQLAALFICRAMSDFDNALTDKKAETQAEICLNSAHSHTVSQNRTFHTPHIKKQDIAETGLCLEVHSYQAEALKVIR